MHKILIVDDDPDFVEITSLFLKSKGYEIVTATNSTEALKAMRAEPPSLVLLDIMMDGILDGLNVSSEMEADPALKNIPIVMISSIADTEHGGLLPTEGELHMDAWFTKPVKPDDLLKEIEQLLG